MFRYKLHQPLPQTLRNDIDPILVYYQCQQHQSLLVTKDTIDQLLTTHGIPFDICEASSWLTQHHQTTDTIDYSLIIGPCGFESRNMTLEIAAFLNEHNITTMRGGCFKPRTSPYSFQGHGTKAFEWLLEAKERYNLNIISEITHADQLLEASYVFDVFQIGSRNMSSFDLIRSVAQQGKPILLKRGFSATYQEWLQAAEYALSYGASNVVLCERGIRSFEPTTRFTFDISAIPAIKTMSSLSIIADPSHACGRTDFIPAISQAALAAGADGIMLEIHPAPKTAKSDASQALTLEQASQLIHTLQKQGTICQ